MGLRRSRAAVGCIRLRLAHPYARSRSLLALYSSASPSPLFLGVPAATIVEREAGRTDPGFVVIDEVIGQWIALLVSPADWRHGLIALVLFRLFDITKPFPVRRLERLPGGWGIVFDDVAAGPVCFGYSVSRSHLVLIPMPRSSPQPDSASPPTCLASTTCVPAAALPNGEVELTGVFLGPNGFGLPGVYVDGEPIARAHEPAHAPGLSRPRLRPPRA